ncbi:MAG: DUF4838 domain-containing protein [Planctomycetes bacterium]|nr:DUF4838 domain-containing protein [Planctomycetota bacterium]
MNSFLRALVLVPWIAMMLHVFPSPGHAQPVPGSIVLTVQGATEYVIVPPEFASVVDEYSLTVLSAGLKANTGVEFPVVSPRELTNQKRKRICLGISRALIEDLGRDPRGEMEDQEIAVQSVEENIYIYGKGLHGNLYAVVDFLDHTLDRRWCVDEYYEKPSYERVETFVVKPFARNRKPSFAYRMLGFPSEFNYQYGYNLCLTQEVCQGWGLPRGTLPVFENPHWVHTSFLYIPPDPGRGWDWLKDKGYFKSNPEFYGLNTNGKRVPEQLCYSNLELRAELTKNILRHISLIRNEKADDRQIMIALDQEDPATGKFCHCDACTSLERRYQSPAGAYFDYLIELSSALQTTQPDVWLKIIGYRPTQTQIPPTMPSGVQFPRNIVVVYCTVEDVIKKSWQDAENVDTHRDLLGWTKLTPHVWVWNYYLYSAGLLMPFSNLERMAIQMRMAKTAGAEVVQFELYPEDGLTPLLQYIYLQLAQDCDSNLREHVKRFCEIQYRAAAELAEKYIWEVESASKTGRKDMTIIHANVDFEGPFSYLTIDNIARWQGYFDEMTRIANDDDRAMKNVNSLRKSLDMATLGRWHALRKAYPETFTDYTVVKARIGRVNILRAGTLADWELKIQAGDVHKPLPPPLNRYPRESILELIPINSANNAKAKTVLDKDAAFGYATTINNPDMPFHFGFHENDTKTAGAVVTLTQGDIQVNHWNIYRLGEIKLTPQCMIWFSNRSWETNLELGGLFEPSSGNQFEAFVSLKFTGAGYGGEGEGLVLCDRIILLRTKHK